MRHFTYGTTYRYHVPPADEPTNGAHQQYNNRKTGTYTCSHCGTSITPKRLDSHTCNDFQARASTRQMSKILKQSTVFPPDATGSTSTHALSAKILHLVTIMGQIADSQMKSLHRRYYDYINRKVGNRSLLFTAKQYV